MGKISFCFSKTSKQILSTFTCYNWSSMLHPDLPRLRSRPKFLSDQTFQTEIISDQTFQTEIHPNQTFQTQVTSDQTFQTQKVSDQTFQTEILPDQTFQTQVSSDQTFQTQKVSDQTFQTEGVLIRPSSDHGPDSNSDNCPNLNQTMIRLKCTQRGLIRPSCARCIYGQTQLRFQLFIIRLKCARN